MGSRPKDQWFDPHAGGGGTEPGEAADGPAGPDSFESRDAPEADDVLGEAEAYAAAGLEAPGGEVVDSDPGPATAEAAEYREALMRVKADFDNYRKRVAKDQATTVQRAAEKLVADLLPVLDACEAALDHGASDVEPIYKSLTDVLEKGGLTRMAAEGQPFDPNLHDAVLHEAGDGGETTVIESLRTGYLWNGRVVRPAMVKVRG
jgi:molecular chaperone GrpE